MQQSIPKIRAITKKLKSYRHAKEISSIQYKNKILIQLPHTCIDVLLKKIKFISKRYLRLVYDEHSNSYFELIMAKKKPVIHPHKNQSLMKEMYKFENDLSSPLIIDIFQVWKNTFQK